MGEVIYVEFRKPESVWEIESGDQLLQMLCADLEPDDFADLQKAITDWDHFRKCDHVIQDLAQSYFRITNKL